MKTKNLWMKAEREEEGNILRELYKQPNSEECGHDSVYPQLCWLHKGFSQPWEATCGQTLPRLGSHT